MFEQEFFNIIALLLRGMVYTIYVTLSCGLTAFFLGLGVAAFRRLSGPFLNSVLGFLIFIIRSIPVLVLLFYVYFGLPSIGLGPSPIVAMNLSLGAIGGAYISEVFRGALASVEKSEIAAARAAGFSRWQVILYVEFPQMLRFSIPGLRNELTAVLKNTPFAYTVGVTEIIGQAKTLTASTMLGISIYFVAGILYLLIYGFFIYIISKINARYKIGALSADPASQ
jgi:polar amino acid transport system permease protein